MLSIDSSLGIEIRGDDLVFTVVKRRLRGFRAGRSQVIENFLQLDKAQLQEKLQQIRKRNGYNRENVVLGLPRSEVILRQIVLPLEAAENLGQIVRYQVEYYQPSDDGASYFDHVVLRQDAEKKKLTLLLALVRKGWLDPYLERLWAAKIVPRRVEVSTSAVFNLIALRKDVLGKGLVVAFDIGSSASEIVVLKGSDEVHSRELPAKASDLTPDMLLEYLQQLFSQIKIEDAAIGRFFFSGTHATPLFQEFRSRFKETELLADAVKSRLQVKESASLNDSVGFALAALSGRRSPFSLNLLPPERRHTISRLAYAPTALLALLLIAGLVALGVRDYYQGRGFGTSLDAQIGILEPQVKELRKTQTDIENARADIAYLEEIMRSRTITMDVLKELTEKMPQDSYLQMLTIDTQARSVDITGYATDTTAIQNLLLHSTYFQKVENKYTTMDQRVKKDRFNFRAEIKP